MQRYGLILAVVLAAFWLALSGYFKPMLLSLGVISILLVLFLCHRMDIIDSETVPYEKMPGLLKYFGWLGGEIASANIIVAKTVLKPDMEISPTVVRVPTRQTYPAGQSLFANSITLTPGTVSVEPDGDEIIVHALLEEMTDLAAFAEMDRRSAKAVDFGKKGGA